MKRVLIAAAIAATLVSPQAFAQAQNFAGFGVALNGHLANASTDVSTVDGSLKIGDHSQNASLQAGYGFVLSNSAVLGLGVTYHLGDLKGGSFSSGGNSFEVKGKDMYSVYIEPGYAFSNSTLVYAKLAYHGMKVEVSGNGSSASEDFEGVGYGLGMRAKLDKNLFFQVEFAQTEFKTKSIEGGSFKPYATLGTVGIGYQF
jgi:opacity protein-like surface antigen